MMRILLGFGLIGLILILAGVFVNPPFWYTSETGCTLNTPAWRCKELERYHRKDLVADQLGVPRFCISWYSAGWNPAAGPCGPYFAYRNGERRQELE